MAAKLETYKGKIGEFPRRITHTNRQIIKEEII
jgi:uncharacterized protein YegP (UPF0339 family)